MRDRCVANRTTVAGQATLIVATSPAARSDFDRIARDTQAGRLSDLGDRSEASKSWRTVFRSFEENGRRVIAPSNTGIPRIRVGHRYLTKGIEKCTDEVPPQ